MKEIDYDEFVRKYGVVIDNMSKRLGKTRTKESLAKALYQDNKLGKININDMNMAVFEFYRGSIVGQVKMDQYTNLYRKNVKL